MARIDVWTLGAIGEVRRGDDLAALIADAARATDTALADGDIVVITSKVVSKAEGRVRRIDREAAIDAEAVRVVASRGTTRITETRHGLVLAAAGVDASNTEPGTVVLLPEDPDASAARIRAGLRDRLGVGVGVVISDTLGRPWRTGQTDAAIGASGVLPVGDLRGRTDSYGNRLEVTEPALADELAAAADLVKGKLAQTPVAVLRGRADLVTGEDGPGARALIRDAGSDMFRYGAADVLGARHTVREFTDEPVDAGAVRRAVAAAATAPAPHHATPWRFVCVRDPARRAELLDAMLDAWIADLRADGLSTDAIARRTRRGEVLRRAPQLIVPCLTGDGMHPYPDERRSAAELSMFWMAMGAGVENLLVALAVEGLGSCWVSSTMFCADVVRRELELPGDWRPAGALGVGHAAAEPRGRPPREPGDLIVLR